MPKQNLRALGEQYEALAARFLMDRGYRILERNFHHHRSGELDLIAKKNGMLVICEVKYRKDISHGDPLEAVTYKKRLFLCKAALGYLSKKGYPQDTPLRFDVIGITGDGNLRHIENAFDFISF